MMKVMMIFLVGFMMISLNVYGQDDVTIDSNGNVQMGVTNSTANLEVTGASAETAIMGSSSGTGGCGVYGRNVEYNSFGVLGCDDSGITASAGLGYYAGYFWGNVRVTGDLIVDGTLTGYTESDPQVGSLMSGMWCTSDGSQVNCSSSAPVISETDPIFGLSPASGITSGLIANWNTAYGWGNHASAGYDATNDSWTGTGNVYTTSGNVGIGTSSPQTKLHIKTSSTNIGGGLRLETSLSTYEDWYFYMDSLDNFKISDDGVDVITIRNNFGYMGIGTTNPLYPLDVEKDGFGYAIRGINTAGPSDNSPAVYGEHAVSDHYGIGVQGKGGFRGVEGRVEGTGGYEYYGVYGYSSTTSGGGSTYGVDGNASGGANNYGVDGSATGAATYNYGVHGYATGAATNYGGYFTGSGGGSAGVGIYASGGTYAGKFYGNYIMVNGAGGEQAYLGGDGAGSDVQIGSTNASVTNVALWNATTLSPMDLYVGALHILGGSDLAEPFDVSDSKNIKPGMLVSIDADNPGQLRISEQSYDKTVAGIVSGAKGIKPGLTMLQEGTETHGKVPVALSGRVYAWADASYGAIVPGDLLTTSDTPGHAMKVMDHIKGQGTIIGKAMTSLKEGKGLVLILVSLQ